MSIINKIKELGKGPQVVTHLEGAPFLKVKDLTVSYNGHIGLNGVNFELQAGEQVAVVGPNGAGKSTLFKVIAGVIQSFSGEVQLSGHAPYGHICIAYLPQRSEIDWSFPVTVRDVVMMGRIGKLGPMRWPKSTDWEIVQDCLSRVNMEKFANRQIAELSGGQQQRMFIARALAQEAELLLMDEPLGGLDAPSREEVFQILGDLKNQSVTLMMATHDLGLASHRFDQVMLLNHKLMGFGKPQQIFTEERLRLAYGNHLQMIETEDGLMIFDDTCCDD